MIYKLLDSILTTSGIPLQHSAQVVQEAVERHVIIAAVMHADEHYAQVVQDVHHLA